MKKYFAAAALLMMMAACGSAGQDKKLEGTTSENQADSDTVSFGN